MGSWRCNLGVDSLELIPGLLKSLQIRAQFFFLSLDLILYFPCRQIQARSLHAKFREERGSLFMAVLVGGGRTTEKLSVVFFTYSCFHTRIVLVSLPAYEQEDGESKGSYIKKTGLKHICERDYYMLLISLHSYMF